MVEVFSDEMLETVTVCPVCAGEQVDFAVEAVDNLFFSSFRKWKYNRCTNCGSLFLINRPKPDFIHLAYQTYYTHNSTTGGVNALVISLLRRYLRSSQDGSLLAIMINLLKPLKSFFEAKTKGVANHSPGKVFDFGCGNGTFLLLCRDIGWSAYGSDFDESAVETARSQGLNVALGGIDALGAQPDNSFDLITLSHVIEHLYEPDLLLAECRKKLKTGGTLWIETPSANARGLQVFRENWRGLEPPRHLLIYTGESLEHTLTAAKFRAIEVKTHFLSSVYIFIKSTHLRHSGSGKLSMIIATLRGFVHEIEVLFSPISAEFLTLTCKK